MKNSLISATLLCYLSGCATAPNPNVNVTVPVDLQTKVEPEEEKADNVREDLRKLPDFPAKPLMKGEAATENGIQISPRNAAESVLAEAEAKRLAAENRALVTLRDKEGKLNEAYTKRLEKDLEVCKKKSWWDDNGKETMLGVGFALGILVTLAVFQTSIKVAQP